jgi:hypothetical protein
LRARDPNYVFPEPELTEFISDLGGYKRGLEDAVQVFARTRDGLVEDTRLNGTPEAIIPIKLVTKHYLGDEFACRDQSYASAHPNGGWGPNSAGYGSNPDLVETALTSLEQTLDNLQKDVAAVNAGQWPTYLLGYRADGEPPA